MAETEINNEERLDESDDSIMLMPTTDGIILISNNKESVEDHVKEVLDTLTEITLEFYELMAMRAELLNYNEILNKLFQSISTNILTKLDTAWGCFSKKQKLISDSRKALSTAHTLIIEYENNLLQHLREHTEYEYMLKDHPIFSHFSEYLLHWANHDSELPQSFKSSISHFEKEIHLSDNLKTIVFASISSAVLGALLTSLLTVTSASPSILQNDDVLKKQVTDTVNNNSQMLDTTNSTIINETEEKKDRP